MKKIVFVIHQLNFGGAQRVLINVMNHLNRDKFDVSLIVFQNADDLEGTLNKDIKIYKLNVSNVRKGIYKLYKTIKIIRPDILFSGIAHVNLIISMMIPFLPKHIKYIARETSIPSQRLKSEKYPFIIQSLYKYFYSNFNLIIAQSQYMKRDLINNYKIKDIKIDVINNPVNIKVEEINTDNVLFDNKNINLLAVGRLHTVKGYDLLLRLISQLDDKYHLYFIGDGDEKNNLIKLVNKLHIEDRVHFLGFQNNPYKYMVQADLMILSSRYEGFPNVVLEANACGLPVVAFDCPGGTGEIIEDGLNGFLVECGNIEKLANKIQEAIYYKWDKEKIVNLTKQRYSVDYIIEKYQELF